ncbi:MAG: MarR family transcriptional regulator [Azospirillaceae bacterium]|nr:MarR family transcriptional regulator [Azospirillaceae bacterium]
MALSPASRRDFGLSLLRLSRRWRHAVDVGMKQYGLTAATWRPLYHLGRLGDGVRLKDLAEALDMERPSLGQLVDRLEREGMVERRGAPDDRRGKTLHLTKVGWGVYERVAELGNTVAQRLTGAVSDEELALCLSVFERIRVAAEAQPPDEGTP